MLGAGQQPNRRVDDEPDHAEHNDDLEDGHHSIVGDLPASDTGRTGAED
jgi:hypothetical protein